MKKNLILIIGLVLCGAVFADLASNIAKLTEYVDAHEYTWQQIKNATPRQLVTHCLAAGVDPNS